MSEPLEVRVYKASKILELWEDQQLKNAFPIGIGKEEQGHKFCEGDLRTPEGEYEICVKNPKSKYYLSLGLNYPNLKDAKLALDSRRITDEQFTAIEQAHFAKKRPPWDTQLGGAIYIHGDLETREWSEGCIRMYKEDIELLFNSLAIGTRVVIFP